MGWLHVVTGRGNLQGLEGSQIIWPARAGEQRVGQLQIVQGAEKFGLYPECRELPTNFLKLRMGGTWSEFHSTETVAQNMENQLVAGGKVGETGMDGLQMLYRVNPPSCAGLRIKPPYITLFLGENVLQVPTFETISWSTTPSYTGDRMC